MKKVIFCCIFITSLSFGQGITTARYADLTAINAISLPPIGMMVYNNATQSYWYRNSTGWVNLAATLSSTQWTTAGSDIYNNNAGSVKITNLASTGPNNRLVFAKPDGTLFSPSANVEGHNYSAVAIPDNNCTGATSAILVSGASSTFPTASSISVTVNIGHAFDGDLAMYLIAPDGSILNLAYRHGGTGNDYSNTTFSDLAPTTIPASGAIAPFNGNFKPTGQTGNAGSCGFAPTVTSFGQIGGGRINPNGTWQLKVFDLSAGDTGTLINWWITFNNDENVLGGNAPLQFANTINNKKLVLWDSYYDQNRFYGFGISAGVLRYQVDSPASDHVFYAATSPSSSNELMRLKGSGDLEVNGGIKTKYSGSVIILPASTGNQLLNLSISPALPAGWDLTNTVVLVSIADGGYGQIGQVKLLNATTIEVRENVQVSGATRYNYIVYKL